MFLLISDLLKENSPVLVTFKSIMFRSLRSQNLPTTARTDGAARMNQLNTADPS